MSRSAGTIAVQQARQAAARAQARQSATSIPDGLGRGGLAVDANPATAGWQNAHAATQTSTADGVDVTIRQTGAKAILNWETFNVGRRTTVTFEQGAGTDASGNNEWVALNRVNDPSGKPSEIAGRIRAEGGVYIINRNGVVFTGSSQVNVRNLVASSLKLSDEQFKAGLNVRLGTTQGEIGWVNGGSHHGMPTFGENPSQMSNQNSIDTVGDGSLEDRLRQVDPFDPGAAPGAVRIEAGALLEAAGGKVMLFAPQVSNSGEIRTPGGQTLLAAGENVWLEARHDNPAVRGFDAVTSAVRPWTFNYGPMVGGSAYNAFERELMTKVMPLMEQRAEQVGYEAVNNGFVLADHGDITMVARSVVQDGVLQASTALNNRDGSIRLRAWGQGMYAHSSSYDGNASFGNLVGWSAGTLTLGSSSVTQVINDWEDGTEIEISALKDRYQPGRIELYGKAVDIRGGASVSAAAGKIDMQAAANPWHIINGNNRRESVGDGSRILVGEDAWVSTAGLLNMPVDIARNFIEVELRINELRDAILVDANSWLYGRKVVVDRRESGRITSGPLTGVQWVSDAAGDQGKWIGTALADVTGWVGNGLIDLAELASVGGNISIQSGGAVITRPGSVLDVSGGSILYDGGWNSTTVLQGANGRAYNIGDATPDQGYTGIAGQYVVTHARWGVTNVYVNPMLGRGYYEAGYLEGADAGAINVEAAGAIILEGEFKGTVQAGNRTQDRSDLPEGGSLTLGGAGNDDRPWTPGRVIISRKPELLPDDFAIDSVIGSAFLDEPENAKGNAGDYRTTWLLESALAGSGLGAITLNVTSSFTLEEGVELDLVPGTRFQVNANNGDGSKGQFQIDGSIRSAGGEIVLSAGSQLHLGAQSVLDTSGQWINDYASGEQTRGRAIAAGSISLGVAQGPDGTYGDVLVGQGAQVDVSGGGWMAADGLARADVVAGNAGSVVLSGFDGEALAALDMRAWSGADAGRLSLNLDRDVQLGGLEPLAGGTGGDSAAGMEGSGSEAGAALVWLPGTLYSDRGYGNVTVNTRGNILVPEGADVRVLPLGWNLLLSGGELAALTSGTQLSDVLPAQRVEALHRVGRAAGGLSLMTSGSGGIRQERGSRLELEAGGAVAMRTYVASGSTQVVGDAAIWLGGGILAPAGRLAVNSGGQLTLADGAELRLPGAAQVYWNPQSQLHQGQVLAGGSVTLESTGNLDAQAGARIDVSGSQGVVEYWHSNVRRPQKLVLELGSDGGTVTVTAPSGLWASQIDAGRGGSMARDGALAVHLASSSGNSGSGNDLKSMLGNSLGDPRWNGDYQLPCGDSCDSLEPWELALDFDWNQVFIDWGMDAGEPIIISRQAVDAWYASGGAVELLVSETAPGGVVQPDPIDSGMNASALDFLRDMMGVNLRSYFDAPPETVSLVVRPSVINTGRIGGLDLSVGSGSSARIGLDDVELSTSRMVRLTGSLFQKGDNHSAVWSPYIQVAGTEAATSMNALAGSLGLHASQVLEVSGGSKVANILGFEHTRLETGDLRFTAPDYAYDTSLSATLKVDGALEIVAAQVYPGTAVKARIESGESITVRSRGTAAAPLSAGGSLTFSAPLIEQYGVLRAPFGEIVLDAQQRLVLGAGSLTSVSGAGLMVPYGTLSNDEYWLDPANPQGKNLNNGKDTTLAEENRYLSALPEKRVALQSADVMLAEGAVVDVSGGGDVYAWEHVPGTGGSFDVLALPGLYAVLPGYEGLSPVVGATSGRQVWLAGGGGLATGWYTLLPARYALLPGAYAVQSTGTSWLDGVSWPQAVTGRDGAVLMQGRERDGYGGSQDSAGAAWRVLSGAQVRQYSEYNEALGNAFFSSEDFRLSQYRLTGLDVVTPRLARDGGAVVFQATGSLRLDGTLVSQADEQGRGGLVDIAARRIAIVGEGQESASLRADGYLIVDAASLSGFGAGSLLVGGTRTGAAQGMGVTVVASDVMLRNDASSVLSGPEVILAASDQVILDEGSVLQAEGKSAGVASDLILSPQQAAVWHNNNTPTDSSDDYIQTQSSDWGALVRVSSGAAVQVLRENVDTARGGEVSVRSGAYIHGGGALLLDATRTTRMDSTAQLSGVALSLASGSIGIGGGAGLVLDEVTLAQLSRTKELTLHSYTSLDFYCSLDLGASGLAQVVFDAAALRGHGGGSVNVQATRLSLRNSSAAAVKPAATGDSGTLRLSAQELVLDAGNKVFDGFGEVTLSGSERILAQGSGSLSASTTALVLETPVLVGLAGANQSVAAEGTLDLRASGSVDAETLAVYGQQSLGARLTLVGQGVGVALPVLALGGSVTVDGGTRDVDLVAGGQLQVGGLARQFYDVTEYVDAGSISLVTRGGVLRLAEGSELGLAAHAGGGNAGSLSLSAVEGGQVMFGGRMSAWAGTNGSPSGNSAAGSGGDFSLDIDQLADFGALAATLNNAGFSGSRRFQVRRGDITLVGDTRVESLEVVADQGMVTVDGSARIDARSQYGGSIRMVAGRGLVMHDGAQLLAGATDTVAGLGSGRIALEAAGGVLDLRGGTLDVSGGEGGSVRLRAQRTAGNDGLAVAALSARVLGTRSAVLEGIRRYQSTDGTVESVKNLAVAEGNSFAGRGAAILAGLGGQASSYRLAAGIEIASDGDLSLGSDWNLAESFGAGAREGTLTLLAGGNLSIDANLSDGFNVAGRQDAAGQAAQLLDASSWDLRLVSGADLSSVDALALQSLGALALGQGTIRVGTADSSAGAADGQGWLVRTGTGDLTVRAGRDLILAHKDSALYTAGRRTANPTLDGRFDTASVSAQYGKQGGHLAVDVQGSVQAPTAQGSRSEQIFSEWLFRQGRKGGDAAKPTSYFDPYQIGQGPYTTLYDDNGNYIGGYYPVILSDQGQQPSWWVNYASFEQGLGALGGGNVSLQAGGDLVNLVVALPTTMRVAGGRSATDEASSVHLENGGLMQVSAGGAIRAGQYYVARGAGELRAGEAVAGYHLDVMEYSNRYEYDIAPVLALGDAALRLQTSGDLVLQTVIDPLLIRRAYTDAQDAAMGSGYYHSSAMSSYTDRSRVALVSTGGDVRLVSQSDHISQHTSQVPGTSVSLATDVVGIFPAQVTAAALGGSISIEGVLPMMPGNTNDLRLLAARSVDFVRVGQGANTYRETGQIVMTRSTLATTPTPLNPGQQSAPLVNMVDSFGVSNEFLLNRRYMRILDNPETLPMQAADFEPSRIYAVSGSITNLDLIASESVHARAGTDIRNFAVDARNLRASDTTVLEAGNDILAMAASRAPRLRANSVYDNASRVVVQGPGQLLLAAGRDIQTNNMQLFSDGNQYWNYAESKPYLNNNQFERIAALPEMGAGITLMAGLTGTVGYEAFVQAYLDPANVGQMPAYLKTVLEDGTEVPLYLVDENEERKGQQKLTRRGLVSYMMQMTGETMTPQQAWESYQVLPLAARQHFLRQVFLYELRDGGRDQNVRNAQGEVRNGGYERGYRAIEVLFPGEGWQGNIAANRMAVRTHSGGDINVLTPGGGVQVAALGATVPNGYGLVTLASPGQVNVFAARDIVVNRSRVLSFVSSVNPLGSDQMLWSTLGDIDAGRGAKTVRVAQAPEVDADEDGNITVSEKLDMSGSGIGTVGEGDVDLVAPKGTVNAGDAGIRVAGNINVAALRVLNAENIQVEGESVGIPAAVAVNIGALTSASSAASAAVSTAQETVARSRASTRQNLPSIINVQILGFGEDGAAKPSASHPDSALQVLGTGRLTTEQLAQLTPEERRRLNM